MQTSMWLNGPTRLLCDVKDDEDDFPLIEPDSEVRTYKTEFETDHFSWVRFLLSSLYNESFSRFKTFRWFWITKFICFERFHKHLRIEMLQSNLYHEENRSNLLDPSFNSVSNSVLYVLTSESGSMREKSSSSSLTSHNKRVHGTNYFVAFQFSSVLWNLSKQTNFEIQNHRNVLKRLKDSLYKLFRRNLTQEKWML
jgi:hypothetical protein